VVSLAVSPDSTIVLLGDSVFLQAVARDQSGHAFIGAPTAWSTSNPAVATVSGTGVAKGLTLGRDTITAASGALTATGVLDVVPRPAIGFGTDSATAPVTAVNATNSPHTVKVTFTLN